MVRTDAVGTSQVNQLIEITGGQVLRLSAYSTAIPYLRLLPDLQELELCLLKAENHMCHPLVPWIDLAPLSILHRLDTLTVSSNSLDPVPFGHLIFLTQLRSLSLVDVMPGARLPPNITGLDHGSRTAFPVASRPQCL